MAKFSLRITTDSERLPLAELVDDISGNTFAIRDVHTFGSDLFGLEITGPGYRLQMDRAKVSVKPVTA
jgi:hypothetical protein